MSEMPKFRKKPVVIEARQLRQDNWREVLDWIQACGGGKNVSYRDNEVFELGMVTIHGDTAYARPGDWIIPEPTLGRFYPCNEAVFAATYEPVPE